MNSAYDPTSEPAGPPTSVAAGGDSESIEDVREFIGSLSTRNCEEAIGLSDRGGLVSGIVQATLGFAAVLIVFTAIPYWISSNKPAATPAAEPAASNENPVAPPVTPGEVPQQDDVDLSEAADVLGIDETKTASPNENPLDNKLDNLLDGVE